MKQDMINKETIHNIRTKRIFPTWEQFIPKVGTILSQGGNIIVQKWEYLRTMFLLLLMLVSLGSIEAWGQVTDGLYYIASGGNNGTYDEFVYDPDAPTTNYYLCPTENWYYYKSSSPYYQQSPDNGMPFMTTYQCLNDNNYDSKKAVWCIQKIGETDHYYIIHVIDGKYLSYNVAMGSSSNAGRMRFHLETSPAANNASEFMFTYVAGTKTYDITTVKESSRKYLNVSGGNQPSRQATHSKYDGPKANGTTQIDVGGTIGLWTAGSTSDQNSRWCPKSTLLTKPTISNVSENNTITITDANSLPTGYKILYTIGDGSQAAPTATEGIEYNGPVSIEHTCVVKAVVVRYGIVLTEVATSGTLQPVTVDAPTFSESCNNTFSLSCGNYPTANIYYNLTTDGSNPEDPTNESTLYSGPVNFQTGYKVRAIAYTNETSHSAVSEKTFAQMYTETPVITVEGSTAIITGPEGATIYYTLDSGEPTTESLVYSDGIDISDMEDVTIRAIAKLPTGLASCETLVILPAQPSITITSDDCESASPRGNVMTISGPNDGRTFWYAITTSNVAPDPTAEHSPYVEYTGSEIVLDSYVSGSNLQCVVHAYAMHDGMRSTVKSQEHQMKTSGKPELTAPTGSSNVLDISNGTVGDKVMIISDNGTPDDENDDVDYTNTDDVIVGSDGTATFDIPNSATGTLHVKFKHGSWLATCEADYEMPGAPPIPEWTQDSDNKLSLNCTDEMAVIHYTINGDMPTKNSPTYSPGCLDNIAVGTTVRAIAVKGFRYSGVMTYVYEYTHVAAPDYFIDGTTVTITVPGNPSETTIYYTTDDSDPTDTSNPNRHVYDSENPITIASGGVTTVIKAYAEKEGMGASSVVRVVTREGYSIRSVSDLNKLSIHPSSYFFVLDDINATGFTGTVSSFSGVLDGGYHTISNLNVPLFNTITSSDAEHNAAVHDVFFDNVDIDVSDGNAGVIAQTATGYTRIYNCGVLATEVSKVSGSANVGSIVGELDGIARVVNCFSYANITGGKYRGGIVGKNDGTSTWRSSSSNITTMVMNCMFYGDISITGRPTAIAPIYGGRKISNKYAQNVTDGLNNYNYFYFNREYVDSITAYNCALGAEERFLNRFEFFRQTLNSTRDLAAWYVSGTVADKELIGKWVLDKTIAPYPILKVPGTYPSVINPDAEHAVAIDADNVHRNEGRKLGMLNVTIRLGSGGAQFNNTGDGVKLNKTFLPLNITDKDPVNFNFNYKKVQLPYYNEVGEGNYTNNRVVTGWKIVEISGAGSSQGKFTAGADVEFNTDGSIKSTPYNFADRSTYAKDLYRSDDSNSNGASGRVFNQGAYWEVPEGVTSITIEPYWAECVYLADDNYDVTYSGTTAKPIGAMGTRTFTSQLGSQIVYNSISSALSNLGTSASSVYDYAIVLVGNYHHCFAASSPTGDRTSPLTIMSADFDNDNEPDYTFFYQHTDRRNVAPLRFDFINIPGIGMVQKADGVESNFQPGIFRPTSWFEITNTTLIQFNQFEYADCKDITKVAAPVILQGGVYEQFVSTRYTHAAGTQYLLIGGNAWFKTFANGCHTNTGLQTPKVPISVTGGDYGKFYLSGIYQPNVNSTAEDAECYIDGGRFGEVAGAGMQKINGNVTWVINGADITSFYGGGINAEKPITGNIYTSISNSHVGEFCGGPKFGNMSGYLTASTDDDKTVTTIATNCDITTFYGAGHGGTAYNRYGHQDQTLSDVVDKGADNWNAWVNSYYNRAYNSTESYNGISTSYEYEYVFYSGGENKKKVARFFVNYASVSLANTNSVSSILSNCKLGTFYGGGKMGAVNGNAISTLIDCEVTNNAYGAGFSAAAPTVDVTPRKNSDNNVGFEVAPKYDNSAGVFNSEQAKAPDAVTYTWDDDASNFNLSDSYFNESKHLIYTNQSLDGLGKVNGTATLNIKGKSVIGTQGVAETGNVYGGGEESNVKENTVVSIEDRTRVLGNVFGGGKGKADSFTCEDAMVGDRDAGLTNPEGGTSVTISSGTVEGNVYGGGEVGRVEKNTVVTIGSESGTSAPFVMGNVFGAGKGVKTHGYSALVRGNTTVTIQGDAKVGKSVYGGGEIASVGRYMIADAAYHAQHPEILEGMPYSLKKDANGKESGKCVVIVKGNAEIGPNGMKMKGTESGKPDDDGHVFGAGKGVLPYEDVVGAPWRMDPNDKEEIFSDSSYTATYGSDYQEKGHDYEADYFRFIETLALATQTEVTISGNAFIKGSVYGGSENGHVQHDTHVTIAGGQIGNGDGVNKRYSESDWASESLAECAHWDYEDNGATYDEYAIYPKNNMYYYDSGCTESSEGGAQEAKDGHTYYGNVFGGGSGVMPYAPGKWLRAAGSVGGNITVDITGGHILTNVYGGNEQTDVGSYIMDSANTPTTPVAETGKCIVNMTGGTVGVPRTLSQILAHPVTGNVFGAGKGDKRVLFNTWTNVVTTEVNITGNARIYGSSFGGGEDGHVIGNTVTNIGGNVTIGIANHAHSDVVIGTLGTSGFDGNVYGGGRGSVTALTAGVVGGNVTLNVMNGTMYGSVYGGGQLASVGTFFAAAKIPDPSDATQMIDNPYYGRMQDGDSHGNIRVNLTGGTISQNVFGGCMGSKENNLLGVSKKVLVELNKNVPDENRGCAVSGAIFGCNNLESSPLDSVLVHIYKTQNIAASRITNPEDGEQTAKVMGRYDIAAVYGGGNQAAYKPYGPNVTSTSYDFKNTTQQAEVIIDGCGQTSIQQVYGGGNAASTPATKVTVNGTYEIEELFGGGNGAGEGNPGANVGFYDYSAVETTYPTKEDRQDATFTSQYVYGTGKASVNIFGGTIHRVFGGSNTKGNVRQSAITMLEDAESCAFCVDEAYGGGKSAPMDAEAKLLMSCIPGLKEVYGGAEAADVYDNVSLTITNGTFDRVFGGNNLSGTIRGSITVNIEETGCRPVIIGELYGGGNLAGYSVYGYNSNKSLKESGTKLYADPQVNVKSFTSIGNVYGGGYGAGAVMVGNPTVNINVVNGAYYNDNRSVVGENAETPNHYPIPSHAKGKIGAINNVFGGGNAAKVIGNTKVNIGTEEGKGADIRGNVYGGGNNAVVDGNTEVQIGK